MPYINHDIKHIYHKILCTSEQNESIKKTLNDLQTAYDKSALFLNILADKTSKEEISFLQLKIGNQLGYENFIQIHNYPKSQKLKNLKQFCFKNLDGIWFIASDEQTTQKYFETIQKDLEKNYYKIENLNLVLQYKNHKTKDFFQTAFKLNAVELHTSGEMKKENLVDTINKLSEQLVKNSG